jgi:dehydrogenase/reductase SDR family protein 7B
MATFLNGKVVWITGASSGIGEQIAIQCSEQGAKVILSSRSFDSLTLIKEKLKGGNHLAIPLDLENSKNFPDLAKQVMDHYGRIDFLFNNGGLSQRSNASETDLSVDRYIMEVNYFGNIALTKAVLPYMIQQKNGHIVVISSIAGKFGFFLRSAYSASKHALQGFYESLALEEENNGLKVTLAYPGKINTNISINALNGTGEKHNAMDHNQETGMPVEQCVSQLLKAVGKEKKEVLIGNKEIKAVFLKRFLPQNLFWKIIRKQSAT